MHRNEFAITIESKDDQKKSTCVHPKLKYRKRRREHSYHYFSIGKASHKMFSITKSSSCIKCSNYSTILIPPPCIELDSIFVPNINENLNSNLSSNQDLNIDSDFKVEKKENSNSSKLLSEKANEKNDSSSKTKQILQSQSDFQSDVTIFDLNRSEKVYSDSILIPTQNEYNNSKLKSDNILNSGFISVPLKKESVEFNSVSNMIINQKNPKQKHKINFIIHKEHKNTIKQ